MQLLTKTLDMRTERDDLQDRLGDLRGRQAELLDDAIDLEDQIESDEHETDESDQQALESVKSKVQSVESLIIVTEGYLEVLERALDDWEGSEITIRELSGAETRAVGARAQKRADQQGLKGYSDSFHETLMLEKAVESTPPGCPDSAQIGDLPDRLFDWLYERANALNSTGEFDMGNSSLREKMMERREQR